METLLLETAKDMHPIDVLVILIVLVVPSILQVAVARTIARRRDLDEPGWGGGVPVALGTNVVCSWCVLGNLLDVTGGIGHFEVVDFAIWAIASAVVFAVPVVGFIAAAGRAADEELLQREKIDELRAIARGDALPDSAYDEEGYEDEPRDYDRFKPPVGFHEQE